MTVETRLFSILLSLPLAFFFLSLFISLSCSKALIIGPEGTPYEGVPFFFDLQVCDVLGSCDGTELVFGCAQWWGPFPVGSPPLSISAPHALFETIYTGGKKRKKIKIIQFLR